MKRRDFRLFELPDGHIGVVDLAWDDILEGYAACQARCSTLTESDWVAAKVAPYLAQGWTLIGEADKGPDLLPVGLPSREFRTCWRFDGETVYSDPTLEMAERWRRVRTERDRRLAESDGLMMRALETGVNVEEWKAYRQALRDIPQVQGNPRLICWPQTP